MVANPKPKKKKKLTPKSIQSDFNAAIRRRDGKCVTCGSTEHLQASHVFAVGGNGGLRFHPKNVHTQCAGCHLEWHNSNHLPYSRYCEDFIGDIEPLITMQVKYSRVNLEIIQDFARKDMLDSIEQFIMSIRI